MKKKTRLLRITTVPISLKILLQGQLSYLKENEFEVLAVSSHGPEISHLTAEGIQHQVVNMTRKITPVQDLISLVRLITVIRDFRPDIVHTHTPKAGLLGIVAAWICRVPIRMHTVAGLPLMERQGVLRVILLIIERITYACATRIYPNSYGLMNFILKEIGFGSKIGMIGAGSSNGIDITFFKRTPELEDHARKLKSRYGIGEQSIVFSFVGRIVNDKGIKELIRAFRLFREKQVEAENCFLLAVGPFEQDLDPIDEEDLQFLSSDKSVILAGYQQDVRPWIMASDIFVFPSYREGFPNVVLQACCLEVPCIVSDINGCNEIVQQKKTGLIVKPKNAHALYEAMHELSCDEDKRRQFGETGRKFVVKNFDQQYVWRELLKEYKSFLDNG